MRVPLRSQLRPRAGNFWGSIMLTGLLLGGLLLGGIPSYRLWPHHLLHRQVRAYWSSRQASAPLASTHAGLVCEERWVNQNHLRVKVQGSWQDVPLMPFAQHIRVRPQTPIDSWLRRMLPSPTRPAAP